MVEDDTNKGKNEAFVDTCVVATFVALVAVVAVVAEPAVVADVALVAVVAFPLREPANVVALKVLLLGLKDNPVPRLNG